MDGRRVLLGVCGGIAAYKIAGLTSTLVQRGAVVDIMMSESATQFVGAVTFAALSARPVYTSLWDAPERIAHVRLVREAEVFLIAPATANVIAKLARGVADDLISTAALAARIPVIVAPAMNSAMLEAPSTHENLELLRARGYTIVEPESGFLAERERGAGRLASEERLLAAIETALAQAVSMQGRRVLITAGPTREAFDPIRFVSNASTGATGIALAAEAARRGAAVTLLLGPTHLPAPAGVETIGFTTADELLALALENGEHADIIIATAAVADWRPSQRSDEKQKKSGEDLSVTLTATPDVLAELGRRGFGKLRIGFAAETQRHEVHANEKLVRKALDAVVVNDVRGERGFGNVENTLTVLTRDGARIELGTAEKTLLAQRLLDVIEALPCS